MFRTYYQLTKPGIIYGNALTAIAGFFLASKGAVDFRLFLAMLVGISLVIASACVFNNYMDKDIDKKMARTKKRALVSGEVSGRNALIYATLLGLVGTFTLGFFTNLLTTFIALLGLFFYVVLYGATKRLTLYGTEVGSVSGAIPIVVGYVSATNRFDHLALILFLILVFWQMPHFYAIAIFRLNDYANAKLPILPVVKGIRETKIRMIFYMLAFIVAVISLTTYGYTGTTYLIVMLALSLIWLLKGLKGFKAKDDTKWAKKMFKFSLLVLMSFSIMLMLNVALP